MKEFSLNRQALRHAGSSSAATQDAAYRLIKFRKRPGSFALSQATLERSDPLIKRIGE